MRVTVAPLQALGVEQPARSESARWRAEIRDDPEVCALVLTELAVRLGWYGRAVEGLLEAGAAFIDMEFEVTGAVGIRRKYQQKAFAQLVCRVRTPKVRALQGALGDVKPSSAASPDGVQPAPGTEEE